jgi:hypothetical protein
MWKKHIDVLGVHIEYLRSKPRFPGELCKWTQTRDGLFDIHQFISDPNTVTCYTLIK